MARYRPDSEGRSPWEWTASTAATASVPVIASVGPMAPAAGVDTAVPSRGLRKGDKVIIYLKDIPMAETISDVIDDKGGVNLPLIGTVRLEGRTTSEAEAILEKAYIDGGFYRQINAIVVSQEDEYFVRGEVKREDRYPLSRDMTLLQALAAAGGYTDFAKTSEIKIIRGQDVMYFNADRIERRKDSDPTVQPGDIIVVPRRFF